MLDNPRYLMAVTVSWNSFLTPGARSPLNQHQKDFPVFNCILLRLLETACLFTKSTPKLFGISFLNEATNAISKLREPPVVLLAGHLADPSVLGVERSLSN